MSLVDPMRSKTAMSRSASPGRWAVRALCVPVIGATLLAGSPAFASVPAPARLPALADALAPARALALAGATPAASATPASVNLTNDAADVKTSNGQSWLLDISDSNSSDALEIELVRTVTAGGTGGEGHLWSFNSKASSLTFSTTTGDGTVTGGSATSPVATIDLAFKATSHKAATCSSGSETIYTGTLSGEAELVTGLTGGGTVGGKSVTFDAKGFSPQILVDSGCVTPTNDCTAATIFTSGKAGAKIQAIGIGETESGKLFNFVGVDSEAKLTAPKGATRADEGYVVGGSPLSWNSKTKVLSVSTTSAGIVTGSATLSGGKATSISYSCSYAGKTYKLTTTQDATAKYASPAGKAITAHTSLTGNLVAPPSAKNGSYVVTTVAK